MEPLKPATLYVLGICCVLTFLIALTYADTHCWLPWLGNYAITQQGCSDINY